MRVAALSGRLFEHPDAMNRLFPIGPLTIETSRAPNRHAPRSRLRIMARIFSRRASRFSGCADASMKRWCSSACVGEDGWRRVKNQHVTPTMQSVKAAVIRQMEKVKSSASASLFSRLQDAQTETIVCHAATHCYCYEIWVRPDDIEQATAALGAR